MTRSPGDAGVLELNVRGGARLFVPDDIDRLSSYILLEQEDWFEEEIRFARRVLRPGMQAVDVGANIGVYTLAMALAVGSSGRVSAFEPTPDCAATLQRNLRINDATHVELHHAAVSDLEGTIALATGEHPETNAIAARGTAGECIIECAALTLDSVAAQQDWSAVDFVKMDVEGHEQEAIRGGTNFFASASPLLMVEIREPDNVNLGLVQLIAQMGYDLYRLLPGPLLLAPFEGSAAADEFLLNVFACKPDRAAKLAADGLLSGSAAAESAAPSQDAWPRYLRDAPYARTLAASWPAKAGPFAPSDDRAYAEGLNAFALSRDGTREPAERLAWLQRAFQCVTDALEAHETAGRRISYARLATELGQRAAGVAALKMNLEPVLEGRPELLAEPFLAPSARYERINGGTDAAGWLKCALFEEFERQRGFSSVFMGTTSLTFIDMIGDSPYRSAEMERRRQLVRIRHGMQNGPQPAAILSELSEDNLNPQFWSGNSATGE